MVLWYSMYGAASRNSRMEAAFHLLLPHSFCLWSQEGQHSHSTGPYTKSTGAFSYAGISCGSAPAADSTYFQTDVLSSSLLCV